MTRRTVLDILMVGAVIAVLVLVALLLPLALRVLNTRPLVGHAAYK